MKFKPGTLVKLAAGLKSHVAFTTTGKTCFLDPNFWFNKNHIGLMIEEHNTSGYVRILVDDQVIVIDQKALQIIV